MEGGKWDLFEDKGRERRGETWKEFEEQSRERESMVRFQMKEEIVTGKERHKSFVKGGKWELFEDKGRERRKET